MDSENRKEYKKMKDRSRKSVRYNPAELPLFEANMRKEGWTNESGFIKSKTIGDPEVNIRKLINEKDPENLVALLRNQMLDLANHYIYVKFRYDKDMAQLYREEGVDLKKWISKTNKWHIELMRKTEETFSMVRRIMNALGLDEYFRMPSDNVKANASSASQAELDSMAEQIRRERIALGLGDILKD